MSTVPHSYTASLADKIKKHVEREGYSEIGLRLKWDEWQTIIAHLTQSPSGPVSEGTLALSETRERWIPVSERLPETGKNLLVVRRDGEVFIDCRVCEPNERFSHWAYANSDGVTHWMPLPEAPLVQR